MDTKQLFSFGESERAMRRPLARPGGEDRERADHGDAVRILSAGELSRLSLAVPASFRLRFPQWWRATPVQNRYAAALASETVSWLQSYGIGRTREEAEKLRKFDCGRYGGCSLPLADFRTALLVTQFISLWLFWDDVQVEEELSWDIDAVVSALRGNAPPPGASRYVAAWADLGRRLAATQSEAWLRRLESTMRQWLENAKAETRMAMEWRRAGVCPEVSRLFDCRTISIGMFPTFHLIEFCEGFVLDESFHADESVVALKRLASRLVGMGNDLGGVAKDIANRWLNLVSISSERSGLSLVEAFQQVVDLHNAEVAEFDRVAARLPSWGSAADVLVRGWVQAVRYNVHGFALWESQAERYQATKAVVGNTPLIAPVAEISM